MQKDHVKMVYFLHKGNKGLKGTSTIKNLILKIRAVHCTSIIKISYQI